MWLFRFFAVFLIISQNVFFIPSVLAKEPKPGRLPTRLQGVLEEARKSRAGANEKVEAANNLTAENNSTDGIKSENPSTEAHMAEARKLAAEFEDAVKSGDTEKQSFVAKKIAAHARDFPDTVIFWATFAEARKLAAEFEDAVKSGDTEKQSFVAEKIETHIRNLPDTFLVWTTFGLFSAAHLKLKAAKVGLAGTAAATVKVAVPVAGSLTAAYLGWQLIQLGQIGEFQGGGLYGRNENLRQQAAEYTLELGRWFSCEPVSVLTPCNGYTTQAQVDDEIKDISDKINELFKEAQKNFNKVVPSANNDYYKPSSNRGGFLGYKDYKFNYLNPILKMRDYIWSFL